MSHSVDVIVRRGGNEIDSLARRPVRIMSSGDAGVVYGGVVHPLHEGDYIDILEEAEPKDSCLGFVETGDSIPYVRFQCGTGGAPVVHKWHVETNQYGNYMVFDGHESTAEALVALMKSAGLGVRRWDTSTRPADDGYTYDWFIRLEFPGAHEDCVRRVGQALGASRLSPTQSEQPIPRQRTPLEVQSDPAVQAELNAKLTRRLAALESALAASEEEVKAGHVRSEAVEGDFRRKLDRAHAQIRSLEAAVSTAREEAKSTREMLSVSRSSEQRALQHLREHGDVGLDVQAAKNEAVEWQRLAEDFAQDAARANTAVSAIQARLEESEMQIGEVKDERDELIRYMDGLQTDLREAQRGRRSRGRLSVEDLLRGLWPKLEFDPDSLEALENDFPRTTQVLWTLNRLANDKLPHRPVTCTRVKESDGLREADCHIATGDPDAGPMGRIYFRPLSDGRKYVLIHKKRDAKEQRRTWQRFAGRDLAAIPSAKR
jgi:hypothetical protein